VIVGAVVSFTVKVVAHVEKLPDASVAVIVTGCGPNPTRVPAVGDCVSVTLLQLSVAVVVAVKSGTAAWHEAFAEPDCAGAQVVIVGGVVSFTVNVATHVEKLPAASVAVMSTGCGPMPTSVPTVGDWLSVTALQLSLAEVLAVKFGTGAMHEAFADADWAGAQLVIVGGVVSLTVNVVMQVDALLKPSVAVMVTVCGPIPTSVPAIGDCVSVTPVQLSFATTSGRKLGTAETHDALADPMWAGAHVVMTGGVESTTVKLVMQVDEFIEASVTVIVTE
jgi:hypothetical protein